MDKKFIIENSLLNLDVEEILKKRNVSKEYRDVIKKSDYLWEKLIQRKFGINLNSNKKDIFIQLYNFEKWCKKQGIMEEKVEKAIECFLEDYENENYGDDYFERFLDYDVCDYIVSLNCDDYNTDTTTWQTLLLYFAYGSYEVDLFIYAVKFNIEDETYLDNLDTIGNLISKFYDYT